jgi:hypothetical protein
VVPPVIGFHLEGENTGRLHRRDRGHRSLLIQQQHLFEANIAELGRVAERCAGRGQRHLTVASPGKGRHGVDLVVAEPWQRLGADSPCHTWRSGSSGSRTCTPKSGWTETVKAPSAPDC